MDPIVMEQNYQKWVSKFVKIKHEAVISIDGKCIRGAGNRDESAAGYAHMLSACLSEEGISPGQLNVDKKTNEMTVFPKLLDMLDIKGCIVTSDAMGCQKEIAHKKKTGGTKSMARMRKQAAWNTEALEVILFQVFPSDDTNTVCQ